MNDPINKHVIPAVFERESTDAPIPGFLIQTFRNDPPSLFRRLNLYNNSQIEQSHLQNYPLQTIFFDYAKPTLSYMPMNTLIGVTDFSTPLEMTNGESLS